MDAVVAAIRASNGEADLSKKAAAVHTHTLSEVSDVTASATEVNYTAGVTSAIQTQLDSKAADAQPAVRVYNSANVSLAHNSATIQNFDSETYDTHGMWEVANPSRLTCPVGKAGKYKVFASVAFAANATGYRGIQFRKTDVSLASSVFIASQFNLSVGDGSETTITLTHEIDLDEGDYVEMRAYQNSGGALNLLRSSDYTMIFGASRSCE